MGTFPRAGNDTINTMPQKRTKNVRTSTSPAKRSGKASSRTSYATQRGRKAQGPTSARSARAAGGRRGMGAEATAGRNASASNGSGKHAGRAGTAKHAPAPRAGTFSQSLSTPTLRGEVAQGYEVKLPGGNQVLLTRRHFLYGAAGLAALAVAGTGSYVYDQVSEKNSGSVSTLSVPEDAVFTTDDCELLEDSSSAIQLVTQKELTYGTLVWANDDTWAACLIPCEEAKPLAQIGMLSLTSGSLNVLVKNAVGESEGFEIYDVRACANGLVWTEADIMDGIWRVYSATTDGGSIGAPALVEEGDGNWEMPTLAATGNHAWWQVLPRTDGAYSMENSKLKRAPFGSTEVEEVYASEGRMCTPIYATAEGVVITPRAKTSGTYYQLTYLNSKAEVVDSLILPSSMRPIEAGYGATGFNFAYDAIYSYGGGIANLGTYTPATAVSAVGADETGAVGSEAYSAPTWFRFPRTPTAGPAWCGRWFMVKSTTAVAGIDFENRQYFTLEVKSGSDSYGDYLATTGTQSRIVTFANIDHVSLEGETQKCCLVRVWSAV